MSRPALTETELQFLARMRVAHLATANAEGQPHVVPIVFAFDGRRLYTPLDQKPKRVEPKELKRVRTLLVNPRVAIVADTYDENWTNLGWMLITGTAEVLETGERHATGVRLLEEKYDQYRDMPLGNRPLIVVTPIHVARWGSL